MATPANAAPDTGVRVYRLGPGRLSMLPIMWAVIMAALASLACDTPAPGTSAGDPSSMILLAAGIISAIMLPFVWITWASRLVLTAQGIAHHQLGYTLRSAWSNVSGLDLSPRAEALYLAQPGTQSALLRWSVKLAGGVGVARADLLGQGRAIVLHPFMHHWKRGPLRDDLQRWAPHLF
jgi:hypothetical protein